MWSARCAHSRREHTRRSLMHRRSGTEAIMDRLEMLIDRLREVAKDMDSPRRRTLEQAADYLENQRTEIMALYKILEENKYGG